MRTKDIADLFIVIGNMENEDAMTNMRINKLLYFAQGYHLQRSGTPLFDEEIKAWTYGPVVESIYRKYQPCGRNIITEPSLDFDQSGISSKDIDFLFDVYEELKQYSTFNLVEKSHKADSPWAKVYKEGENNTIEVSLIKEYFDSLDSLPHKAFHMSPGIKTIGRIDPKTGKTVLPAEEYDEDEDAEYDNL